MPTPSEQHASGGLGIAWMLRVLRERRMRPGEGSVAGPPGPTALDERHMARALDLADRAAAEGEVPVGAVVYHTATGEVLGEGSNRREGTGDPSAHAEFLAILEACRHRGDWRLDDCSVVVTLEPCPMCAGLVVNARVGRVVYGAADPKAGAVRSLMRVCDDPRLNHRAAIVAGVRAPECSRRLSDFFRTLRAARRSSRGEG